MSFCIVFSFSHCRDFWCDCFCIILSVFHIFINFAVFICNFFSFLKLFIAFPLLLVLCFISYDRMWFRWCFTHILHISFILPLFLYCWDGFDVTLCYSKNSFTSYDVIRVVLYSSLVFQFLSRSLFWRMSLLFPRTLPHVQSINNMLNCGSL